MTQDVQPLTWQKKTNLEEHQQFFSKINEIIDNLAPTVDEAEAAIAHAIAAIASADDAIATANAASAAASAAASQAQTAASTVAGYDTRLTAVEGEADTNTDNITALQGRMGTAEGDITALQGRMGTAEGDITALLAADAQNVKINRINDYAVGLTGNQDNIIGSKNFRTSTFLNRNYHTVIESTYNGRGWHKMFRLRQTAGSMIHVVGMSTGSQVPHNVFFEFVNYTDRITSPVFIELSSDVETMVDVSNFAVVPVTVDGVPYLDYYINFVISSYSGLHVAVDMKSRNNGAVTLSDAQIIYYENAPEDPTALSNVVYGINGKVYSL